MGCQVMFGPARLVRHEGLLAVESPIPKVSASKDGRPGVVAGQREAAFEADNRLRQPTMRVQAFFMEGPKPFTAKSSEYADEKDRDGAESGAFLSVFRVFRGLL